jgi:CcmD family protein
MRSISLLRLAAVIAASLALAGTPSSAASAQDSLTTAATVGPVDALPGEQAAAPPRTLRAYWHVFIAFALAWALLFGYTISLGRRFRRVEDEVDRLRGTP